MPNQNQLQEMMGNIDILEIGLHDGFRFSCRGCGECCRHREDILLSPRDLFKIASHVGKSNEEIIEMYCEMYIGGSSRIPIVRLKPKGVNKDCPLLDNNRCKVHASKPAVCALFPLGRFMKFAADDSAIISEKMTTQIHYLLNPTHCGGRDYNKVSRWLDSFGIEPNDAIYLLWVKTTTRLGGFIRNLEKAEKKIPNVGFEAIWTVAYNLLYIRYDNGQEFLPQFEANTTEMWRVIDDMDAKLIQPFLRGALTNAT